ncbi:MAG TPA: serine hydrolase domain-containing protein [Gemmatimonadaceae bacterium]|nr:serine hydrolase domain-containing protein [Gemmatimonadaceae bacterium]
MTAPRGGAASLLLALLCACATPPRPAVVPDPGGPIRVVRDSVAGVLDRALADSAFPGAIGVVGTRDGALTSYAVGRIDWAATAPAPDARTLWDLASLTKVVGMTTAMMQLVEQDRVELDAPVARYLPEFTGEGKDRVTIRHLLTHSSGLPSWRPLYKEAAAADTAIAIVLATPLDTVPGARMVYSDLGAILLGKVVERVSGETLDAYLARHVFGPLGMTSTMYRPDASVHDRVAPTEFDPWRQRHIRGEVHDENAFMLGGVSGHAGLFSTAADLTRFARMMLAGGVLDGVRVLRPSTIAQFTAVQDPGLSHRALGWETPSGQNSAGRAMSARAFGHTGFTGTSLWMDPERGAFVLLLTNRVNPSRQNTRIGLVRIALADAAIAALDAACPPSLPSP